MNKRTTRSTYQYEPLVTPAKWQGDERRFSIRLSQLLDDLFGKYGTVASKVKTLENAGSTPSDPAAPSVSLLDVYPVGSIYMSLSETDPGQLFGGAWARIKDTFLLAAGDTYEVGSEGGEAAHQLTVEEMPSHSHNFKTKSNASAAGTAYSRMASNGDEVDTLITNAGGDQPHNNMPPYLAVNIWKRTA